MIVYIIVGLLFIAAACVWNYYEIHESVDSKPKKERSHTKESR